MTILYELKSHTVTSEEVPQDVTWKYHKLRWLAIVCMSLFIDVKLDHVTPDTCTLTLSEVEPIGYSADASS